jgi:spore coat polysaccharide biosynthesis predicted glycosyltransferase SpsG
MSAPLRLAVLTEAGHGPGLGHFRRCMALGFAAVELGAQVRLLVAGDIPPEPSRDGRRRLDFEPCDWLGRADVGFAALDHGPADVIIVDSYAATAAFLERLGAHVPCAVLLDDLADRATPVDVVVNGGFQAAQLRYRGKPDSVYLLGPRYALLDSAFAEPPSRGAVGVVRRVLVTLGGDAPAERFDTVVHAVRRAAPAAEVDVVIGPFTVWKAENRDRIRVHRGLTSLRPLMLVADLAVTAGGMTLYECLASGTPIVALAIADNQRPNVASLGAAGLLIDGNASLERAIERLAADADMRATMSRRGRDVVDGDGARRVVREIERITAARGVAGRS